MSDITSSNSNENENFGTDGWTAAGDAIGAAAGLITAGPPQAGEVNDAIDAIGQDNFASLAPSEQTLLPSVGNTEDHRIQRVTDFKTVLRKARLLKQARQAIPGQGEPLTIAPENGV